MDGRAHAANAGSSWYGRHAAELYLKRMDQHGIQSKLILRWLY